MQENPNNPPPQGFGVNLWNWIVTNILYIKRRLNAIGNGGGGTPQVNSDWNATSGVAEILNKPTIPDAQVNSDWDATGTVAEILNKPDLTIYEVLANKVTDFSSPDNTTYPTSLATANLVATVSPAGKLSTDGSNSMTADLNVGSNKLINVATPSSATDGANKAYVDSTVTGLSPKTSVRVATAAALPTVTYNNGASGVGATLTAVAVGVLTIDGVDTILGDRVLIKNQVLQEHNGIYSVTTAGTAGVAFVLTRTTDADTGAELVSAYTYTGAEGATNASQGFIQSTPATITVGTTAIVWNLFNSNVYTEGTGIRISGNIIYSKLSEGVTGGQSVKGGTAANDTLTHQGSVSSDPRTTTSPAHLFNSAGVLGSSSSAQVFAQYSTTVAASGTAGYTAMKVSVTETSNGSGSKYLINLLAGASGTTSKFAVDNTGLVIQTSAGTKYVGGVTGSTTVFVADTMSGDLTIRWPTTAPLPGDALYSPNGDGKLSWSNLGNANKLWLYYNFI